MQRPTSPRQHKKTQKELKTQGKPFSINPKSHLPLPTEANNPLVEYSLLPQNSNRQAIQEPTIPAHLDRQAQDPQQQLTEIIQTIAEQQSVQLMPLPNLNNNSHHNEHPILNHQVTFIPNDYKLYQSIPQSNSDNQPIPPQNILIRIQRKIPLRWTSKPKIIRRKPLNHKPIHQVSP